MTEPRTIHCEKRKCGFRKEGSVYLVTELDPSGILPAWTDIDPPIPYDGEQFRGIKFIDLERLLAGEPYLAGASQERSRREKIHEPEEEIWGMPLRTRSATGICRGRGLDAVGELALNDVSGFGIALRSLSRIQMGHAASAEIPRTWREAKKMNLPATLAALWRLWRSCSPGKKKDAAPYVRLAMCAISAEEDAMEVYV